MNVYEITGFIVIWGLALIASLVLLYFVVRYLSVAIQLVRANLLAQYANPKKEIIDHEWKQKFLWRPRLYLNSITNWRNVFSLMGSDSIYNKYFSVDFNTFIPKISIKECAEKIGKKR